MQVLSKNLFYNMSKSTKTLRAEPHTYFAKKLMSVDLDEACDLYYKSVERHQDYKGPNFYLFGKLFEAHRLNMNDGVIENIKKLINKFMLLNSKNENKAPLAEVINMIYSTVLKYITQQDIHENRVSPQIYRALISEGKEMYYKFPVNEMVDYRHILGRMNYLRQINKEYKDRVGKIPYQKHDIEWTLNDQLDYIDVLEKIVNRYDKITENFSIPHEEYVDCIHKSFTKEHSKELYELNLYTTLEMISNNVKLEIKNLESLVKEQQTKDKVLDIIADIEIGYEYFDKISFDSPKINKAWKILNKLKDSEKILLQKLKFGS